MNGDRDPGSGIRDSPASARRGRFHATNSGVPLLVTLLAAAICPYFLDLGGSSIWDANEAFYVETPREMIERGDYISPTFNYEPRLNKPVLSYWIVAGFYHLFGISVGVQRLPIALGAVVLIATAFFLARAAWPGPSASGTVAGLWAALGLAISPRLVMFARRIFIDIYISMFLGLTLLFFAMSERYAERRRLFLTLMYVSVGLGTLTKGPVAIVLPALAFGLYLLLQGELRRVRGMMIPAGTAIVLAIVVPWYAALYQRHGWTYIVSFLVGENVARFTEGYGVHADRGPFFYVPILFSEVFPWSILLVAAAAAWFTDRRHPAVEGDRGSRIRTLLWLWILAIVGFFSLSAAKQDLYIFPIVPAVAALCGVLIARLGFRGSGLGARGPEVRGSEEEGTHVQLSPAVASIGWISSGVAGALVMLFGGGVLYFFLPANATYALDGATLVGIISLAGGAVALVLAARRRVHAALLTLAAAFVALNWVFVGRVLPSFETYKPVPRFARVLSERAAPDDVIATYNEALPSLVYYLGRHVEMAYVPGPIVSFLESDRTAYVILSRHEYDEITAATRTPTCIISTQPTFDVKLRNVLAADPLPDLLLITNRCGGI